MLIFSNRIRYWIGLILQALELEELLEESNTASILLGLNENASTDDMDSKNNDSKASDKSKQNVALGKGNIIEQLRQRIRVEAASSRERAMSSLFHSESLAVAGESVDMNTSSSSTAGAATSVPSHAVRSSSSSSSVANNNPASAFEWDSKSLSTMNILEEFERKDVIVGEQDLEK